MITYDQCKGIVMRNFDNYDEALAAYSIDIMDMHRDHLPPWVNSNKDIREYRIGYVMDRMDDEGYRVSEDEAIVALNRARNTLRRM